MMHLSAGPGHGNINSFPLVGQGMGWSLCQDGLEGHVGGQVGYGGTMIYKQSEHGTFGILAMMNINLMFHGESRKWEWFRDYYFGIEQLLLQAAEEMLVQKSES
jgi:hypothetical protein